MPKYKLKARFWDGQQLHPVGSIVDLPEGSVPSGSVLIEEEKPAPKATVKKD